MRKSEGGLSLYPCVAGVWGYVCVLAVSSYARRDMCETFKHFSQLFGEDDSCGDDFFQLKDSDRGEQSP